ncbi:MAG TPA: hypothetical protein V6D20_10980 [Candidatus Obscuribacterales bacterium]
MASLWVNPPNTLTDGDRSLRAIARETDVAYIDCSFMSDKT